MKRIFIGTNILLDLVMKRHSFYQEAKRLFDYCDQRNIKTYISAISMFVFLSNEHIAANFASFSIVKFSIVSNEVQHFGNLGNGHVCVFGQETEN